MNFIFEDLNCFFDECILAHHHTYHRFRTDLGIFTKIMTKEDIILNSSLNLYKKE